MSAAAAQAKADVTPVELTGAASVTIQLTEEQIAARAYEIFEREGSVHGNHNDHWFQAIAELQAETN